MSGKVLAGFLFLIGLALVVPKPSQAIIILPAIILIPIAKLVAVVIAGLTLPTATLGAVWSKLFHKSLRQTVLIIVLVLLILAVVSGLILKLLFPYLPFL